MKHHLIILLLILPAHHLFSQTREDSLAITQAALDYVEGWQAGDTGRVMRAVSTELAKRQVRHDGSGRAFVSPMGATLLRAATNANREGVKAEDRTPGEPFRVDVRILDIDGNNASVKTHNGKYGFMDYVHLAKMDGEWKIINVLWDWSPGKK